MSSEAFVTLATNDGYALGALVLGQSIRKVGTKRRLVVMISKNLSELLRKTLQSTFDEVIVVPELDSQDAEHLRLLSRPELGVTFTKLHCWRLDQYTKCVFIDADCVVLQSIDDLFEREEFSAAPDAGWPDCFNSGLFVYRPSKETHQKLMEFANQQDASFDGGDQGLLNAFFSNWRSSDISRHIPFTYNVTSNAFYSYLPAVTQFRSDIRMVHFAGAAKPWQLTYNPQTQQLSGNLGGQHEIQREFLLQWWQVMHERVWPQLSSNSPLSDGNNLLDGSQQDQSQSQGAFGLVGAGSSALNYGSLTSQGVETGSAAHRRAWEAGHIDYSGRDSFSHIQQQLERNIAQQQPPYHPSQLRQTTPEQQQVPTQTATKPPTPPPATIQKQPTPPLATTQKQPTPPPATTQKQPTPPLATTQKQPTPPPATTQKQPTPPLATTHKQATPPPTTTERQATPPASSGVQNLQSLGAALPSNQKGASSEHESSWNVKSTIVTQHTQGVGAAAGSTTVTKTVSEASASSANNVPPTSSITEKAGGSVSAQSSGANVTGSNTSGRGTTPPTTTTTKDQSRVTKS